MKLICRKETSHTQRVLVLQNGQAVRGLAAKLHGDYYHEQENRKVQLQEILRGR